MSYVPYILTTILIIIWLFGYFVFDVGIVIHFLPFEAAVILFINCIKLNKNGKHQSVNPVPVFKPKENDKTQLKASVKLHSKQLFFK